MSERVSVLGVDPSLRGMAYALAADGALVEERWEKSAPAEGVRARIARYRKLVDPIEDVARRYTPRVALVETYPYGMQGSAVVDLGELGGLLRDRLLQHCEHVLEVNVVHVKIFATGSAGGGALPKGLTPQQRREQLAQRRKDSKGAVKRALEGRYGRVFRNDDAADAYALMRMGLCLVGLAEPMDDGERRAVAALRARSEAA